VTKKPKGWTEEAWAAKFLKISIATTNRNTMDDDAKARYKMARARIMKEMMASSMAEQATPAMQPPAVIQLPPPTPKQPSPTVIDDPSASSIRFSLFGL
jgi:hypothetical protein